MRIMVREWLSILLKSFVSIKMRYSTVGVHVRIVSLLHVLLHIVMYWYLLLHVHIFIFLCPGGKTWRVLRIRSSCYGYSWSRSVYNGGVFVLFCCIFLTDVYQLLKDSLSQDDAVVGEAAGVGMGLVMLGTCSEIAIKDMIEVSNKIMYIMYNNVFIYLFLSLSLSLVL